MVISGGESATVVKMLCRYPIKGMRAEKLAEVALQESQTMPFDRMYAVENGQGRFDPMAPKYLPKVNFLMLMRNERLATLETEFDTETHVLTIKRDGKQVARGALNTPIGRTVIEQFLAAYMKDDLRGAPRIVWSQGHSFSDVSSKVLHIVNLASVRELERLAGRTVDPMRFRANIYVDGFEPRAEIKWLDREIVIGPVRLCVTALTDRCEATNVEPSSGTRDISIPSLIERSFGHTDFGVYARVVSDGVVRINDPVTEVAPQSS